MPPDVSNSAAKSSRGPALWLFFAMAMVLLVLFWGATVWLTRGQGGDADPEEAARAEFRAKTLAELRADNAKKLESYAWVDRAKGSVQIPITEAMKLVLADINNIQPRPAYPVATPAPAVAPSPAQAPATPAPATP
ncbi:MAG: hypothetical protein WCH98_02260 [Verrucomicrobiota bacterium]